MEKRASVHDLLDHYNSLLGLYEKLGDVSRQVFEDLKAGKPATHIAGRLRENAAIADSITAESKTIARIKSQLVTNGVLSERERSMVRDSEQRLAVTVDRVIEEQNKNRDLMSSQGVKISRR